MKSVTILSTVKNIKSTVNAWLDSIINQDYSGNFNIIIIDSCSTDGTKEILRGYSINHKNIEIINYECTQPQALNFALNNNLVSGELIALIDGDCVAPKNWLTMLVTTLENKDVDAVGGPGLTPKNTNLLQRVIGFDLDSRFLSMSEGLVKRHPNMNLLIKKEVIKKIKFNESLLVGYDADFGFRLNRMGYSLWYDPNIAILHYHRASLKGYIKQQFITGKFATKLYLTEKNEIKGDNINPVTMTLQPLCYGLFALFLLLSLLTNYFVILSMISFIIVILFFSFDVVKAYKISKTPLTLMLYPLYALRLNVWMIGAVFGIFSMIKEGMQ